MDNVETRSVDEIAAALSLPDSHRWVMWIAHDERGVAIIDESEYQFDIEVARADSVSASIPVLMVEAYQRLKEQEAGRGESEA